MTARNLLSGARFRRDVKLAQRRAKDMSKLRELILLLGQGNPLPPHYKDHPITGSADSSHQSPESRVPNSESRAPDR